MRVWRDLRSLDAGEAATRTSALPAEEAAVLTAWQLAAGAGGAGSPVVVPDFLNYARLINTGQAGAMLRLPGGLGRGLRAVASAMPAVLRSPLRAASKDFWLVSDALVRYDLALLPSSWRGPVILHPYLADFAFAFANRDFVRKFHGAAARRGQAGCWTLQPRAALSCLSLWGIDPEVFVLFASPGLRQEALLLETAREGGVLAGAQVVADFSSVPGAGTGVSGLAAAVILPA